MPQHMNKATGYYLYDRVAQSVPVGGPYTTFDQAWAARAGKSGAGEAEANFQILYIVQNTSVNLVGTGGPHHGGKLIQIDSIT